MNTSTTQHSVDVNSPPKIYASVAQAIAAQDLPALRTALRCAIAFENLPNDLKSHKGFVCWKVTDINQDTGKFNKIPYYPVSGKLRHGKQGSDEDVANLGTWDEALAAFNEGNDKGDGMGPYVGIGFAMLPEWGLVAFDADHCVKDGFVKNNVMQLVKGTYAEISPSGTGIRSFWRGKATNGNNSKTGFELYSTKQFVTLTGNRLENQYPADEAAFPLLGDELRKILEQLSTLPNMGTKSAPSKHKPNTSADVNAQTLDDLYSAMSVFTEEDADEYGLWIRIGLALKSLVPAGYTQQAEKLWHAFSDLSEKYTGEEAKAKWSGFHPNEISHLTIFSLAAERGWVNPKSSQAQGSQTRLDHTDAGNVNVLAIVSHSYLRYAPECDLWLNWSGRRWEPDHHRQKAQEIALRVAEYHIQEAEKLPQGKGDDLVESKRRRIWQWAMTCRNRRSIDSMLSMAESDSRFILSVSKLDRDPWLLGVPNGVVDLRTGTLRDACREDYVTQSSPIDFNPDAKAPRWEQFIAEITSKPSPTNGAKQTPRPGLANYLQRVLGYTLTGCTNEHKMFIAIGEGANGKNVLLDRVMSIMGDYGRNLPPEALMASKYDADPARATPHIQMLEGARAAISSESNTSQRLDIAMVKRHTGDSYMTARGLHQAPRTFQITHKLWLMTNHKPALDHMDEAVKGRLHLIPFDMRWNRPGHPAPDSKLPDGDKDLPDRLRKEEEGILAWMVRGAVAYHKEGLKPPPEVTSMTNDFFKTQDPFGLWLEEWEPCEPKNGTKASTLLGQFMQWCEAEGYSEQENISQTAFSAQLKRRGIMSHKCNSGRLYGLLQKTSSGGGKK